MQTIYNILLTLGMILISPFYMVKLWKRGNWQKGFGQRFGKFDNKIKQAVTNSHVVWVHGVSVGEANISINLVQHLTALNPLTKFVVSTTTTTGMGELVKKLPLHVSKIYYPIDRKKFVNRSMGTIRPELIILVEAEIWPNFLWRAQRRRIPVMLINARISKNSFKNYKRFGFIFRPLFREFVMVGAQNEEDKKRLVELGCRESAVHVTGPIKFDLTSLPAQTRINVDKLLETIGIKKNTPILLGGSTHPGEEKILGNVFLKLKKQFPSLFLIIVPRHFERSGSVGAEMRDLGIKCNFRSSISSMKEASDSRRSDCLIVNSTGELMNFYKVATVVFVGKSLCGEGGGQNPIEPASLGLPIVFGPLMQNFQDIARDMVHNGAAARADNEQILAETLEQLFLSPSTRQAMGAAGIEITKEKQGALAKTLDLIEANFPEFD